MKPSLSFTRVLPKTKDIFYMSLFFSALMLGQRMINLDGDLPRHILMGKYILEHRNIPTVELFIHPYLNQTYVPHEWLTDVIYALLYTRWGTAGIVIFCAFLLAVTFTILYDNLTNKLNLRLPVLLLIAWGAGATSLNWAARPHVVSMCLLAIWLFWTDELRKNENVRIWPFPVLMLVWCNLHGEFIAGMLVLFAYAAGWLFEYLFDRNNVNPKIGVNIFLALGVSVCASFVNPSGIGPWTSVLGFVNNQYLMSRMVEANAPSFQNVDTRVFFGLLILSIFLLAIKRDKISAGQGILLTGFSLMGLMAIRNIHLYGIVAPFILAETFTGIRNIPIVGRIERTLENIENGNKAVLWTAVSTTLFVTIVLTNTSIKTFYQFREPAFPVRAVEWLEDHPQTGNMFNNLDWGGYVALHLWPQQLPFIDSMSDTSGNVTRQYETMITLDNGWEDTLKAYNISYAVIPPQITLAEKLIAKDWKIVYQDDTAVILVAPNN